MKIITNKHFFKLLLHNKIIPRLRAARCVDVFTKVCRDEVIKLIKDLSGFVLPWGFLREKRRKTYGNGAVLQEFSSGTQIESGSLIATSN